MVAFAWLAALRFGCFRSTLSWWLHPLTWLFQKHFVLVAASPDFLELEIDEMLEILGQDGLYVDKEEQVCYGRQYVSLPRTARYRQIYELVKKGFGICTVFLWYALLPTHAFVLYPKCACHSYFDILKSFLFFKKVICSCLKFKKNIASFGGGS